jgi:hypothetical protein
MRIWVYFQLGIFPARQVRDEGFQRLPSGKLPGSREGHDRPLAERLDQGQIGSRGIGGIGSDEDLLAPGRTPEILPHLPKQRIVGLVGGVVGTPDPRKIYRHAIDIPLGHEAHDPKAEDLGMVLAQARFLGYGMLGPPRALERTVAH